MIEGKDSVEPTDKVLECQTIQTNTTQVLKDQPCL
jgi:hypothetical protein